MAERLRTKSADTYVELHRRKNSAEATWFDVADAFDAGIRHALLDRPKAKAEIDWLDLPRRIDSVTPTSAAEPK